MTNKNPMTIETAADRIIISKGFALSKKISDKHVPKYDAVAVTHAAQATNFI